LKDLTDILNAYQKIDGRAALATVVKIVGTAYRKPGARLLIRSDGSTVGTISGGCLEGDVVEKANENIVDWNLEGKLKFVEADVLNIPFVDGGFDAVCDFGLFETLYKEDWIKYVNEINRVLKPGGLYLNVSLSRETHHFFEFSPKAGADVDFEKYGIHYHFFGEEEIKTIFLDKFEVISQKTELAKTNGKIVLLETLFQKK